MSTARFLLLISETREARDYRSEADGRALYAEMIAFGERLAAKGQLIATEALRPDRHAVRVEIRVGHTLLRDGPFTETHEMIGGFYLVECAGRDEALALAAECPAARFAAVEVRECAPCYVQ